MTEIIFFWVNLFNRFYWKWHFRVTPFCRDHSSV